MLRSCRRAGGGMRLSIETSLATQLATGESIAVDGACLTVAAANGVTFEADASGETLARSSLGSARRGGRVNLERAVRADGRLGGHMVTGHVDGMGCVTRRTRHGSYLEMEVKPDTQLLGAVLLKGSVAVDGVSLTISATEGQSFWVTLIPETLARTTLGTKNVGAKVNLETDIIGKYVEEYLGRAAGAVEDERAGASDSAGPRALGSLLDGRLREGG